MTEPTGTDMPEWNIEEQLRNSVINIDNQRRAAVGLVSVALEALEIERAAHAETTQRWKRQQANIGNMFTDAYATRAAHDLTRSQLASETSARIDAQATTALLATAAKEAQEFLAAEMEDHRSTRANLWFSEQQVAAHAAEAEDAWGQLAAAEEDLEATKVAYRDVLDKNALLVAIAQECNEIATEACDRRDAALEDLGAYVRVNDNAHAEIDRLRSVVSGVEAINEGLATDVVDLRADIAVHETTCRRFQAEADERDEQIEFLGRCLRAANREIDQRDLDALIRPW